MSKVKTTRLPAGQATQNLKLFLNKIANHPLQSWEWGEFRRAWGNEVVRFPFGQITIHKIPFTSFKIGIFEKGPAPTGKMLTELKNYGRKNNLIFIKLEPNIPVQINNSTMHVHTRIVKKNAVSKIIKLLKRHGAVKGRRLFTPETFWIDLTKSEEELLNSFSPKTRYNIRLAQRKGVTVEVDPPSLRLRGASNAFEKYLELTFETAKRQGFFAHTPQYHRLMWKHLHQSPISNPERASSAYNQLPIARLLVARYKGEIITTWIVFVWKDFLYYPYGASSSNPGYKPLMANNLVMWEAIRFGKKLGLKTFDLWGREPGKGFTKFKEGYNPTVVEFLGSWDLVINKPVYWLYRAAETLRWWLLRLKTKFTIFNS